VTLSRGLPFRTVDPEALVDDPRPERTVARDIVRHGLILGPLLILGCGAIWGIDGAISSGYAVVIVLVNFLLAAALITWAAPISLPLLMGAVLGGYVARLALIFLAVFLVHEASWFEKVPLGLTIIVTHLVLLIWELRYVAASLAYPGLKPSPVKPSPTAPTP
jgi:hypothetical protein